MKIVTQHRLLKTIVGLINHHYKKKTFFSISKPSSLPFQTHFFPRTPTPPRAATKHPLLVFSKNPISDIVCATLSHAEEGALDNEKSCEECAVVGIYDDPEASRLYYLILYALHHCGQEGIKIVTVNNNVL